MLYLIIAHVVLLNYNIKLTDYITYIIQLLTIEALDMM